MRLLFDISYNNKEYKNCILNYNNAQNALEFRYNFTDWAESWEENRIYFTCAWIEYIEQQRIIFNVAKKNRRAFRKTLCLLFKIRRL